MLYVRRGPLGDRDLALLNANLAKTGTSSADPGCDKPLGLDVSYVLRGTTAAGQQVWFTSQAACLPHFHVNNQRHITITLDQKTVDMITGPLDRFP